ncbi:amidase [Labrys wisconsinensis]|uniref:Amidase n=1 Tax=Labrys wisconsinensis TaxID=425677 RepID=A0ABU0J3K9_9HYPH|nr:amidase [Labrys wisconsinensis]MDQ0467792.1 amidase [Labrys wisconsinensis]
MRSIAAAVQAGTLTAEAATAACLARVAAREDAVRAWAFLDPELALAEARERDRTGAHGPLAGVAIGVKDIIDTADQPTAYGSAAYEGYRPAWDAPCVALSRQAGAVMLGKTVSTEFAFVAPGKTRNPFDPGHTPGGSSSGSCAAVADGMVPLAFGTQTAGSIVRPASFCGVVGYKPSYGTLERAGIKVLSGSLDTLGVITRDVRDAAHAVAVLARRPALAVPDVALPPRIGLFRTSRWDMAEAATRQALDRAVAALAARGVAVREVAVPGWFDELFAMQDIVMGWELMQALAHERLVLAERLAPKTLALMAEKEAITLADYDAAVAALAPLQQRFHALIGDLDALLTPAAPGEAPAGLGSTGDAVFNRAWTMLRVPGIAVPAGLGPGGLPVGVQLVGRLGDDARLLAAAAFVEDSLAA